jgi:hypothetical protein
MIRFLQQFEKGSGDYARERHAWVDSFTEDDLDSLVRKPTQAKKRQKKKWAAVLLDSCAPLLLPHCFPYEASGTPSPAPKA